MTALPDELPFDFTPLPALGKALLTAIPGDYISYLEGDDDGDEDISRINGWKWDEVDVRDPEEGVERGEDYGLSGLKMKGGYSIDKRLARE